MNISNFSIPQMIVGLRHAKFLLLMFAVVTFNLNIAYAKDDAAVSPLSAMAAEKLIESFATAADKQDAAALEAIIHPAFRVVFSTKAGATPSVLDRALFLKLVRDGKIGGAARKVSITALSKTESYVTATVVMTRADAIFQGTYTLIEQDGRLQLLQEAVLMTVNELRK
jgi:hypothetical protein